MSVLLNIAKPLPEDADEALIKKACRLVFDKASKDFNGQLDLVFVDREISQQLNNKYAKNDYPTDVLSFNYQESGEISGSDQLGEIVICIDLARDQAKEYDLPVKVEIVLLFVHGILHILGYDHQDQDNQARFSKLQDDIIERLSLKSRQFKWPH